MQLKGERALLTGGSGGLGSEVARALARAGVDVTLVDRSGGADGPFRHIACDLSNEEDVRRLIGEIEGERWDILVNLAGVQHFGPFGAQGASSMVSTYMVNLVAPALLIQAVAPGMRRRGRGRIVNVGSIFGSINFANFASYSSSKAGLHGLSQALRREFAGSGVRVIYVAPRAVNTPMNSERVRAFAKLTGMSMDEPARVARRIVAAIRRCEREVFLGFPESVFVRLNGLAPWLVDNALAPNDRRAADLFQNKEQTHA